jgi:hypothetical protein
MEDSKWERWSALGGILFVALIVASVVLPGSPPKTSDSVAKIAKFVADHRSELRWAAYLGGLGTVAILWWLGAVWRLMRRGEGGVPRLAVVAFGGAAFASVTATLAGVILGVVAILGVPASGGASGTKFFYVLSTNVGAATNFGVALFIGAFSAVIIRSRILPVALGWIGALLFLVGGATVATTDDAFFVIGFIAFFAFLLWVLVVSVLMLRGPSAEPVSSTA